MSKILLTIIIILVLGGAGFLAYKYFFGGRIIPKQNGPTGTQFCDLTKQKCESFTKSFNSGSAKVTVKAGENFVNNLEVDLGEKPGADQYYLAITDNNGVALFNGIPAGSYVIYFNQINFPPGLPTPEPQRISIVKDQTKEITIQLSK